MCQSSATGELTDCACFELTRLCASPVLALESKLPHKAANVELRHRSLAANPTPESTSSPADNAGEAFAASPRRGDTPPPCAAATSENPPKAPSRATTSRHEKENIPQAGPASPCEPAPVTYRCKKHCLNGASRYAIYRVDDDAEVLRQQQRRSENGVVAAVLSGDGVVLAAATTTTTRRRPLSSMGLQRRHTIGSSRDVKFHPFPTPTSSSFRRVPSGQRLDEGEAWKRLGGARVASPV